MQFLGPRKTRKNTKIKALEQNINSPNWLHNYIVYFLVSFVFFVLFVDNCFFRV